MNKKIIIGLFLFSLVIFPKKNYANLLPVDVINSKYTTVVSYFIDDISGETETYSRTTISTNPTNDFLYHDSDFYKSYAIAASHADLFEISTFTESVDDYNNTVAYRSRADAESEITFSPFRDSLHTIELYFTGYDSWWYSEGFVKLFDITSGIEIWNYHWFSSIGNVPWIWATAFLAVDTDFTAEHTYKLTMYASVNANYDSQGINVKLSGLDAVPEPSTIFLLGLALIGMLGFKRRYKN